VILSPLGSFCLTPLVVLVDDRVSLLLEREEIPTTALLSLLVALSRTLLSIDDVLDLVVLLP
jgi:hypothetical protein